MLKQLDVLIGFAVVMSIVSMLIMVVNQMILSGLQLRGKQLMDALEAMFKTLKPDLGEKAKALAEAVLRHPAISDSAKRGDKRGLASAIRPEELLDVLRSLAASATDPTKWIGNSTFKHQDQLSEEDKTIEKVTKSASELLGVFEQPGNAVSQTMVKVQPKLENVEKWFRTVEDRAREWFATNAQQWNVVLAIVLAFGLQLDAFLLYTQLESDDAYRAMVASEAAAVQKQTQEMRNHLDKATKDSAPAEFEYWKKERENMQKTAATMDKAAQSHSFQLLPATYPKTFWEWIGWFRRSNSEESATAIRNCYFSTEGLSVDVGHFFGMAFFAALLSLGAPYWFNLLKTLTSFRPLLAQEVDKDREKKDNAIKKAPAGPV